MSDGVLMAYILGSVAAMLLFALSVVFFFNFSQRKIITTKLQMQTLELNFQKELLENTIKTQESERDRIAQDLHDEVASKLNIIHLNLHVLRQRVSNMSDISPLLEQIDSSLKESSERTRTISHELMPPLLKKFGLVQVLEDLKDNVNMTDNFHFQIVDFELLQIKEHFKMLHIYRMVQELVNNTLKYANAEQATLTFMTLPNQQIQMVYEDDGKGFDTETIKRGHGLSNIEARIRLLNGTLRIKNDLPRGVNFTFIFPNYD